MRLIYNILKCLGYYNKSFETHDDDDMFIYDDSGFNINLVGEPEPNHNPHTKCIYLYNFIIISILSWGLIYSLYIVIANKDWPYLYKSAFRLFILVQYIIGMIYFKSNHIISKFHKHNKLVAKTRIALIISFVCVFVLCITNIFLIIYDKNIFIYSSIYSMNKLGSIFLHLVETFYSYLSFFTNTSIFVITMVYHRYRLTYYKNNLTTYADSSISLAQKINSIITEYSNLKEDHNYTIKKLSPFFIALSIGGIVHSYCMALLYTDYTISVSEILNTVMLLIILIIYIYSFQIVANSLVDINSIVNSPIFINNCIRKNVSEKELPTVLNNQITNEQIYNIVVQSYITNVESSEFESWLMLTHIIKQPWEYFSLFGLIEMNGSNMVQKLISILCLILASKTLIQIII